MELIESREVSLGIMFTTIIFCAIASSKTLKSLKSGPFRKYVRPKGERWYPSKSAKVCKARGGPEIDEIKSK